MRRVTIAVEDATLAVEDGILAVEVETERFAHDLALRGVEFLQFRDEIVVRAKRDLTHLCAGWSSTYFNFRVVVIRSSDLPSSSANATVGTYTHNSTGEVY